ncbi:hypothetical protein J6K93_07000 [Leuconostoc mesenteroides]|nr:hypothetical protein [Leuconostoc mesenteroides]MBZ1525927.1 hypothetical protein [Leuconostoc mesenteroides]QUY16965.1 hypothetical protein GWG51_08370 [Leuconostoc mesenteroides]
MTELKNPYTNKCWKKEQKPKIKKPLTIKSGAFVVLKIGYVPKHDHGVAFTPDNYRVGYGAGFFDRVLSKYSKDTISLVLPPQLIDNFSRNQWDMPVKNMLT